MGTHLGFVAGMRAGPFKFQCVDFATPAKASSSEGSHMRFSCMAY